MYVCVRVSYSKHKVQCAVTRISQHAANSAVVVVVAEEEGGTIPTHTRALATLPTILTPCPTILLSQACVALSRWQPRCVARALSLSLSLWQPRCVEPPELGLGSHGACWIIGVRDRVDSGAQFVHHVRHHCHYFRVRLSNVVLLCHVGHNIVETAARVHSARGCVLVDPIPR